MLVLISNLSVVCNIGYDIGSVFGHFVTYDDGKSCKSLRVNVNIDSAARHIQFFCKSSTNFVFNIHVVIADHHSYQRKWRK